MMILLRLFLALIFFSPLLAWGEDHYVSQSGAGTGASCASPRSAAWFNTVGNWTSVSAVDGLVGPGDIVRLCSTITSNLTFQGDGASGNHITVDGTGATMNANFVAGANKSFGTIQNVTWIDAFSGNPFTCTSCDNFIFRNNSTDNWSGGNAVWITEDGANQQPNNITVANNFFRTSTANLGDVQNDIIKCTSCVNTTVEGNHIEMRIVGASPYVSSHNDLIQSFQKGGASLGPPSNLTVRYNKFVMNTTESNHRAWCILEHLGGTNYFYGNVFLGIQGAGGANGCAIYNGQAGVVHHFVGNTVVAKGTATQVVLNLLDTGTINLRNNIFYTAGNQAYTMTMATINRSNNLWFGTNAPACTGTAEICGQNPQFTDLTNNDFSLQGISPAINTGSNLGTPYDKYIVPGSTWPTPTLGQRPASGAWEMSAYELVSTPGLPAVVAAYNADFGSGTVLTDASGNGHTGLLNAGAAWTLSGKYGKALTMDGVDDYVSLGDIAAAEGGNKLTVSFWIKQSALVANKTLVSKWARFSCDSTSENVFLVRTQTTNDEILVFIGSGADAGVNYFYTTDMNLTTGVWQHIAFVYDGAAAGNAQRMKAYKNGTLVNGDYGGVIPATMNSGGRQVMLGDALWGAGYFGGDMDNIRIYAAALTPGELAIDRDTAIP